MLVVTMFGMPPPVPATVNTRIATVYAQHCEVLSRTRHNDAASVPATFFLDWPACRLVPRTLPFVLAKRASCAEKRAVGKRDTTKKIVARVSELLRLNICF